jgi:hypothetical protein
MVGHALTPSSWILVVDSSEIVEGKLDEVKAGVEDLVAFVEANEAERSRTRSTSARRASR